MKESRTEDKLWIDIARANPEENGITLKEYREKKRMAPIVIIRDTPVMRFVNKETGEEVMAFELQEPTTVDLAEGPKVFYPHDYEVVHGDGKVTMEDKLSFELAFKETDLPPVEEPKTIEEIVGESNLKGKGGE